MIEALGPDVSYLLVGTLLLLLTVVGWFALEGRPKGIPPGPRGLPVVGYLPIYISSSKKRLLPKLQKKYGPMFSMYFEKQLVVFLQDYDSIHKALVEQGDLFSSRPKDIPGVMYKSDETAIINLSGQPMREHRRFALSTLRDFGIGKLSLEPQILDEISYFLEEINKQKGEAFHLHKHVSKSVSNNICALVFGKRFDYNDPKFIKLLGLLDFAVRYLAYTVIHRKLPWLRYIPFTEKLHQYEHLKNWHKADTEFSVEMMEKHRKEFTPGKKDSFIDAYFNEQLQREKTKNNPELFDDNTLVTNLRVIFGAGTETTSTTIEWAILFMLLHPDVQRKVHAEIDDVIGRERTPTAEDKLRMPYTEATLYETSRRGSVIPHNLPHSNLEETHLKGFLIPKDTMIIPNIYAVHHDEKVFPDPFCFRPERFINEHGQFVKNEHVIPFSIGKRYCPGEPLARMELFLYFTSMLQRFTFKNPEGQVLSVDSEPDFINPPPQFKILAVPRI